METERLMQRLTNTLSVVPVMVDGFSVEEMRWKPASGNWSLLEIVCHLAHEDQFDFRARLKSTLDDPTQPWPAIDPEKTVVEEGFNTREPESAIQWFIDVRRESLRWLETVVSSPTDWTAAYVHPKLGPIQAGELLTNWVAHDQLHVRQMAKRIHELTVAQSPEHRVDYAGPMN